MAIKKIAAKRAKKTLPTRPRPRRIRTRIDMGRRTEEYVILEAATPTELAAKINAEYEAIKEMIAAKQVRFGHFYLAGGVIFDGQRYLQAALFASGRPGSLD
jgi:predicted DNA-binding protein (UPF0278 family)